MIATLRIAYGAFCLAIGFAVWLIAYGLALLLLYQDGRILEATITTNPLAPVQQLLLYPDSRVLRRIVLLSAIPAMLVSGVVGCLVARRRASPLGDARFQNTAMLWRAGWFDKKGHVIGRYGRRLLRVNDDRHHLIIGPTRSGKGACYVIPNALTHQGSMIVTDLKGEIFETTAGYRKAKGNQVFLFAPGSERSHRYNPLDYIRPDRGDRTTDIQNIASILIPENADSENAIWQATAQQVMAGVISYVQESVHYEGRRNLAEVNALFNSGMNLQDLMYSIREREPNLSRFTVESFNAYAALPDRAAASALLDVQKALWPFRNERVSAATCVSDIDVRAIKHRPISIYLAPKVTDITLLKPLMALFVQQTLDTLMVEREPRSLPVYFLLDEFRQLKKMGEITTKLPYVAGYNIKMAFVIQDLKNLDEIYGESARHSLMGNCGYQLVLGANDQVTAESISKSLGRRTVRYTTESHAISFLGLHRRTRVEHLRDRDLMMPQEVRQMPPDKMLILAEGQNPILADKLRYFETAPFQTQARLAMAAPLFVPATEVLPQRSATSSHSGGASPSVSSPFTSTTVGRGDMEHEVGPQGATARTRPRSITGGPDPADASAANIEKRFDVAMKRLQSLVAAREPNNPSANNWSVIFDETVPDASDD